MAVRFQLRRDTAANWASANSVLALGEPGVETDTLKVKVGDGSTAWNSLGYSITKDFTDLTSTPTTLAGYGITDALALSGLSVTQNAASGTGALSYNNATGVFEYTPPDFAGLTGDFTGSVFADDSTIMVDGVSATLNFVNNSITDLPDADQTVQTTDDVTFNSVTGNVITSQIDSADSSAIEIQTDVTMLAGLTVGNHIVPSSSENIDLGSASARFRDLYLSGNSAIIGDLALKRHISGGLLVADHSTGNPTNVTTHNITANDITAAGDVDVTGNLTMTGYIAGPATFTIDPAAVGDNTGTVVIAGDLQVDGTTTTINSTTLEVEDKNVVLGPNAANDAANNGAGLTVTQPDTSDASLIYNTTDTQWELNKKLDIAGKVTSTDIDILSNNPRIRLDDSDTDNNAEVTLDNTSLRIEVDEDDAIADSLIKFRVDADTKAVITSDGRLGIGYDSPSNNIHILGSDASPNVGITLQSDDTANATAALSLFARNASNINITSEIKNVAGQLFIERSDAGTDVLALKSTAAGAGGPQLDFYHHSASPADNDVIGTINFNGWDDASNATTYARISGIAADVSNGAEKGDLIISTRTDASTFSEKVRVTNGGNVGIGTNPSQIFEVEKAADDKLVYGSNPRLVLDTPTGINGLRVLGDTTPFEFKIDSGTYNGSAFSMGGTGDVSLLGATTTAGDTFNDSPTFFFNSMRWNGSANSTHFQGAIKGHTRSATNGDGYLGIGADANANHLNIETNGTVGVGTTDLDSWSTVFDGRVRLGATGFVGSTSASTQLGNNWLYDGSAYKRIAEDYALRYYQNGGDHVWETAESAAADSTITWATKMFLGSNGNLEIGYAGAARQQADSQALSIITPASGGGQGIALKRLDSNTDQILGEISWSNNTQDGQANIRVKTAGAVNTTDMIFEVNNAGTLTEAIRIDGSASGNVGIGDTSPAAKLTVGAGNASTFVHVNNASTGDVSSGYNIISGSTTTTSLYGNADEGWTTLLSGGALNFRVNNAVSGFNPLGIATDGTVNFTEIMKLDGNNAYFISTATNGYRFNNSNDAFNNMIIAENGNVTIRGALSKGSGSFRIPHPVASKTATHDLVHSFLEAPQADNLYRGKVDLVAGSATVNIDTVAGMTNGTFAALNREVQCFTSNETGWTAVKGSVSGNMLTITAQDSSCTDTISWMVVGERKDQHMYDTDWTDENGKVIVEPTKRPDKI